MFSFINCQMIINDNKSLIEIALHRLTEKETSSASRKEFNNVDWWKKHLAEALWRTEGKHWKFKFYITRRFFFIEWAIVKIVVAVVIRVETASGKVKIVKFLIPNIESILWNCCPGTIKIRLKIYFTSYSIHIQFHLKWNGPGQKSKRNWPELFLGGTSLICCRYVDDDDDGLFQCLPFKMI